MKIFIAVIFQLAVLVSVTPAISQGKVTKALKKGDVVPNIEFIAWKGDSSFKARLSDFKDKVILLDFWNSFCPSCLAATPEFVKWQEIFKKDLQILMVTKESREELMLRLEKFYSKSKNLPWRNALQTLTLINSDSILEKMFPHKMLPTHVWINPDLTLKSVAYPSSTTYENLQSLISKKPVKLDELKYLSIEVEKPLTWIGSYDLYQLDHAEYTVKAGYIENGQKGVEKITFLKDQPSGRLNGIACLNTPLLNLCKIAYDYWRPDKKINYIPNNRIIIETDNPAKFSFIETERQSFGEWYEQYAVCLAFQSEPMDSLSFYKKVSRMIEFHFNIKSGLETRNVKCWVLKRKAGKDLLKAKGKQPYYSSKSGTTIIKSLKMDALSNFIFGTLQAKFKNPILINKTNYEQFIDITLHWDSRQSTFPISEIQKNLSKYGLILTQEIVPLSMLVITDLNKKG